MRVRRIHVENYRGFEHLTLDLPEVGPVVLIGENGSGKSSLLRLLAFGVARVLDPMERLPIPAVDQRDIRRGAEAVAARIDFDDGRSWRLDPFQGDGTGGSGVVNAGLGASVPRGTMFAYIPAHRFVEGDRDETVGAVFVSSRATFTRFLEWFREVEDVENEVRLRADPNHRDPRLECVRRALERFVAALPGAEYRHPRFSRVGEWAAGGRGTFLVDKQGVTLALEQLSDGEALTLLLVGDLARRLTDVRAGPDDALARAGVVLVDELEQHLHPRWQRAVLPALMATFPNVQFITTTHSPVVLGTIARENVVWLHEFRRVDAMPRTYGRDVTTLLVDVMRLSPHPEPVESLLARIAEALDAEDFRRARELLNDLEKLLGPDDPDVIRNQAALSFLEDGA
jgi:energy-coupling factor transporter ATP-binding protein EcfA2